MQKNPVQYPVPGYHNRKRPPIPDLVNAYPSMAPRLNSNVICFSYLECVDTYEDTPSTHLPDTLLLHSYTSR